MSFCAPICPAAASQQCIQQQHSSTSTSASAAAGQIPTSRPINSSAQSFLQKLKTRSNLPPANYCDTVHPVEPGVTQATAGTDACTPAGLAAAAAASVPPEQSAPGCDTAEEAHDTDAACDEDCSADTRSSVAAQSAPFDSFLEQAQEAAALLAAACGGTSRVQDIGGTGSDGAAAGTAAVSAYHHQLDSMLQAVEQLESQLEQRARPVRVL